MPHRLRRFRKKEFAYASAEASSETASDASEVSSETSEAAELSLSEATEAAEDVEAVLELFFEPLSEP